MHAKSLYFRSCPLYHGLLSFSLIGFFTALLLLFSACEKGISIDVSESSKQMSIDSWVDAGEQVNVVLTLSSPFFSKYDSITLRKLVATYAKVTISDGDTTEILNLEKNNDFFPPYVYRSQYIKGKIGGRYTLTVYADGLIHTAKTEILEPTSLISHWTKKAGDSDDDSSRTLYIQIKDRLNEKNFYRIYTKILHKETVFVPIISSVWSDAFFDGVNYTFMLQRGFEDFSKQNHNLTYTVGDTVVVKLCSIDETSFKFWYNAEQQMYNSSNPFAGAHSNLRSTFDNNALGVFTGYSYTLDTLVVK